VVILDNLSAHKVAGVRERIEAAGTHLLDRPPYSPDLNPSEQASSKGKQILRWLKARSSEALESAVAEALNAITAENAIAWFAVMIYSKYKNALAQPARAGFLTRKTLSAGVTIASHKTWYRS
jgi:transposase